MSKDKETSGTDRVVKRALEESSTKVYVPPTLRGHYPVKSTPAGTRLALNPKATATKK